MVLTRIDAPAEKLELMTAHQGICRHCSGPVKMERDQKTLDLLPDQCWCFACGQHYYMEIKDIKAWEKEQWEQKLAEI